MNMTQFIEKHGLTMEWKAVDENPNMPDPAGSPMFHYAVTITRTGSKTPFTLHYSKGSAHVEPAHRQRLLSPPIRPIPPALPEVLDCLASDVAGFEDAPLFEDWAANYGYDPDSLTAANTFQAVQRQAAQLKKLLGAPGLADLLRVCSEGDADDSGKELGRLVPSGAYGFLNPPGHPEHDWSVHTGPEHSPSGVQSLSSAVDAEWLSPITREAARAKLAEWAPLPLDDPAVKDWIHQVLGYFRNSYADPSKPESERWNVANLKSTVPTENADELHAGVHLIRKYYPEYQPSADDLARAYWGTKPTKS